MALNMNPYTYTAGTDSFRISLRSSTAKWSIYSVAFSSACALPYPDNNRVPGDYYRTVNGKAPLIILLHGLGDLSVLPCRLLARSLAGAGINSFILYLPFHPRRINEEQKRRYPGLTADEWFENYRVSVINVRQVIDWAGHRPEIDISRIALFGISLGGFVSAITMGIDQRVKAGVLAVMGGNSTKIGQYSRRYGLHRGLSRPDDAYKRLQEVYRSYLVDVEVKGFDNVTPAEPFFMTDSLTFAPMLKSRPLLMVNGLWDEAIPREATVDFWEACGQPEIVWLPATHASIWLWYPVIRRKIFRFLKDYL